MQSKCISVVFRTEFENDLRFALENHFDTILVTLFLITFEATVEGERLSLEQNEHHFRIQHEKVVYTVTLKIFLRNEMFITLFHNTQIKQMFC